MYLVYWNKYDISCHPFLESSCCDPSYSVRCCVSVVIVASYSVGYFIEVPEKMRFLFPIIVCRLWFMFKIGYIMAWRSCYFIVFVKLGNTNKTTQVRRDIRWKINPISTNARYWQILLFSICPVLIGWWLYLHGYWMSYYTPATNDFILPFIISKVGDVGTNTAITQLLMLIIKSIYLIIQW